jgi:hypothetical protein
MSTRKPDQKNHKAKFPYRAPTLKEYGNVAEITRGDLGTVSDALGASQAPD